MDSPGEKLLDGDDAPGERNNADEQGHSIAVPAGDQEGHAEQPLFIEGVEEDEGVDYAGDDIQGEAFKNGKGGKNVAGHHDGRTDDHRQQLLAGSGVSPAVAYEEKNTFQQYQTTQCQRNSHQPVVVVEELDACADRYYPGIWDKNTGEEVDDVADEHQHQPHVAAVVLFLLQKINDKAEVGVGKEHDSCQGHLIPYPGRGPELAAHGKGAANPQNHDK